VAKNGLQSSQISSLMQVGDGKGVAEDMRADWLSNPGSLSNDLDVLLDSPHGQWKLGFF